MGGHAPAALAELILVALAVAFLAFGVRDRMTEVLSVESSLDGRRYIVRNLPDAQDAADLLSTLVQRLASLVDDMGHTAAYHPGVKRLQKNFRPDSVSEGTGENGYTSYSMNKGQQLVFCLRHKDSRNTLVDINTLMFVGTHELAHLMTKGVGHTPAFWANFRRLLRRAVELNLYVPVDYAMLPQPYCGIQISSTVL